MSDTSIRLHSYEELLADNPYASVFCLRDRITMPLLESMFVEIGKAIYLPDMLEPPNVRPADPDSECPEMPEIIPSGEWDPEVADKLPLIVVDVGNIQYKPIEGFDGVARRPMPNGALIEMVREAVTSVVFQHLGKTKPQSMAYAAFTHDMLDVFSYAIKTHFNFEKVFISGIVKPNYRDEYKDWESLVQVDLVFREAFTLIEESQELKKIALKF